MSSPAAPELAMPERLWPDPAAQLVHGLCDAAAYPHKPAAVAHLETHISHVFLTGPFAYKVKKSLELGFLDFSTLAKRRFFCEEELRINRRLAPELYLAVVPVAGTPEHPKVEGTGPAIEYAVKMRQFAQEGMLEQVLARGELTLAMIDNVAAEVAKFHAGLPPAEADAQFGSAASIMQAARQNFVQLAPLLVTATDRSTLDALGAWTERQHAELAQVFAERQRDGFVRECHGDLHLGNMVMVEGAVRIFDAIEFNPELRWIDVISEVAFLGMDLAHRGRSDLSWRFINAYLERTGDYAGVRVLRYYLVYRALVRAKVAAIRASQPDMERTQAEGLRAKCRNHLALAKAFVEQSASAVIIHHGVSGSGKTTGSQAILEAIGAIRIRSDIERKRLHGLDAQARTGSAVATGLYGSETTSATYQRLAILAEQAVTGGFPVLIDATFLKRAQRSQFRDLASRLGVPFAIADFRADEASLRERVTRRAQAGGDASEADSAVLEYQLTTQDSLSDEEQALSTPFDTQRMNATELQAEARKMATRLTGQPTIPRRDPK